MKNLVVEPGTMLYSTLPYRLMVGWVVKIQTIKTLAGSYKNYVVEWASGYIDNLSIKQVHKYRKAYLDFQKQHGV